MGDPGTAAEIRAAGAVLWRARPTGYGIEVALVHRPRYDDWAFPKGKALPGEHPPLTAVREVAEETGVRPVLGRPLPQVRYLSGGRPKRVDYWAATAAAPWMQGRLIPNGGAGSRGQVGLTSPEGPEFVPNEEVDKLEWLPVAEAGRRLSYAHDVGLLEEFAAAPVTTIPYIFLRHASAVAKEARSEDDLLRPLDDAGRAEAGALAGLLACFGPARVFSSAAARCVETVLPYSVRAGVIAAAEPAFSLQAAGGEAAAGVRLAGLLADGLPMILCGHRETLPMRYAQAVRQFGASPAADLSLAKGGFAVLHVARTAGAAFLVAAEQHEAAAERHDVGAERRDDAAG